MGIEITKRGDLVGWFAGLVHLHSLKCLKQLGIDS